MIPPVRVSFVSVGAALGLLLACDPGAASPASSTGRPTVRGERLADDERVALDGRLDEPIWRRTTPAASFLQREPIEGADPTQLTEVHVAYDRHALYLGILLHDTDPSAVLGYQRQRDADLSSDDRFQFVLDTFLDGRTAYFFEINPAGQMGDGLLRAGSVNRSWDGIWEARVARDAHGWSAEIRLPFRTLNFDPKLEAWGINFQRTIRRYNEDALWSGHRRNEGLFSVVHAGRLVGLEGVSQGLGLEARPYTAASSKQAPGAQGVGATDVGVDIGYSITPSLRAALTVNTDFAETDVDQRQVNLTRFPLQFPERRQFFLEGSSVYSFAPASGVNPYFSRRIGLVDGEPAPIVYGARLGGQAGPFDVGLLHVRTAREGTVAAEDFTVARLRRNVWRQSSLGAIYTRRATDGTDGIDSLPARQTVGVDVDLNTSTFLGDKNVRFEGFYVWHTNPASTATPARERSSRGVRLAFPQDAWRAHVSLREFGREWDPAVGFAPRRGFRRLQPSVAWSPRPRWRAVRQLDFEVSFEHLTDLSGRLETQRLSLTPVDIRFESGDRLEWEWTRAFERLDVPFAIASGVVLPAGDYRFDDMELSVSSASRRRVSAGGSLRWGEFWSGTRRQVDGGLTIRPTSGVRVTFEGDRRLVRLPEGRFATTLGRLSAQWQASPWTAATATVQYDTVSRIAGLYSRLRWIVRPGSDVYVVYTHNWQQHDTRWSTLSRGATTKVNYTHRF